MTNKSLTFHGAWIAFAIVSAFYLLEFIARIEPSLASSDIAAHFGLSNSGFGTVSSIFFWIYAPMQLVVGLALDRYGPRRLVVPAVLVMSLGVALFSFSDNVYFAAFGRFLTGLGASFGFVGGLYVVTHMFAPSRFAAMSGALNAIGMLGTAVGAIALTSLIDGAGWQSVFRATAAAGLVLFVFAAIFLKDTGEPPAEQGAFLAPLKEVVTNGRIWWIALLGALYYMPVNVFGGLWGRSELMSDHGLTSVRAETAVSMIFWGMAAGSILAGWVSDRLGHRKWIIASNAGLAALAYSAAIYVDSSSVLFISVMLFLGGLFSGAQMLTFAMAKEGQSKAISGTVMSFVNMVGIGGALIFQPLVGSLVDLSGGSFGLALLTLPACLVLSAIMAMFLGELRHSDHKDD